MRNRILLGAVLALLTGLLFAEAAQAQVFYVRGGRGGFSAGYGPAWYGGYGYRGYGEYSYSGWPSSGMYYDRYPYQSYYYSPYGYSYYPYGYTRYRSAPANAASFTVHIPAQPPVASRSEAWLRISLPTPDAQLWIENVPMRTTLGTERSFVTPPLAAGTYTYRIRASWMDGDREVSREQQVTVRPGEETPVSFREFARAAQ